MRRRVFTLVELLTVIAVVAVLAGLLFPAVSLVQDRARRTDCLSRVRQIGQALYLYTGDSGGFLPDCARLGPSGGRPGVRGVLEPYATAEVFHCPGDRAPSGVQAYWFDPAVATSYEWNTVLNGRQLDRARFTILGLEVAPPLLGDAESFHRDGRRNYLYADGHTEPSLVILIRQTE